MLVHTHTNVPVPKVLAWSTDSSNPVGSEYIIMEKAPGVPLVKKMDEMTDLEQLSLVKQLTNLEGELTAIRLPAHGSLYLRESMKPGDTYIELHPDVDPAGRFCVVSSCDRKWFHPDQSMMRRYCPDDGPCEYSANTPSS